MPIWVISICDGSYSLAALSRDPASWPRPTALSDIPWLVRTQIERSRRCFRSERPCRRTGVAVASFAPSAAMKSGICGWMAMQEAIFG